MKWILIMTALYAIGSAEFETLEACQEAGEAYRAMQGYGHGSHFVCVEKGTPPSALYQEGGGT